MSNLEPSAEALTKAETIRAGRLEWIDYAKGIGIILVVYGHVVIGITNAGIVASATENLQLFPKYSLDLIYTFHMSLFFFLSGLVADGNPSKSKGDFKSLFWKKVKTIAYPYLVWSIIQGIISALMSDYTNSEFNIVELPIRILFIPIAHYWFLYALFAHHLIFALTKKILNINIYAILFVSVLMYLIWPYMNVFPIKIITGTFVYYVLGSISAKVLRDAVGKISPIKFISISLVCLLMQVCLFFFETSFLKLDPSQPAAINFLGASLGILSTLCLAIYLAKIKIMDFLQYLGFLSMPIYLAHLLSVVGVRIILQKVFHVNDLILHIIAGTSVGLIFPIILYQITKKLRFPYLFSLSKRSSLSSAISGSEAAISTRN
jgi:fucose 4-O-acetylase-like acetyltransferase